MVVNYNGRLFGGEKDQLVVSDSFPNFNPNQEIPELFLICRHPVRSIVGYRIVKNLNLIDL